MSSYLNVEYKIWTEETRVTVIVRGSGEAPGLTEIVHTEKDSKDERIIMDDEALPLLIEALQRRYEDSKKEKETHK